jgi:hypothetical protein
MNRSRRSGAIYEVARTTTARLVSMIRCLPAVAGGRSKAGTVAYYRMKPLVVPERDGYAICFESPTPESGG